MLRRTYSVVTARFSLFGEWLRDLRDVKSVPIRVVAANVDLDSTLVSKFECGDRIPTDAQGVALADYFKVPRNEMHKQLVAARILRNHGSDPAFRDVITVVREYAESPKNYVRKQVTYSKPRKKN